MKSIKTILAVFAMLALTGCFSDDNSVCPPDSNVTLHFRMPDDDVERSFLGNGLTAITAIYDESGELVEEVITIDQHYQVFKGITLSLDPGTYRVVSWGNTGVNTVHNDIDYNYKDGADAVVTYKDIVDGKIQHGGDALYYAPNSVSPTRVGTGEGNEAGEYIMTVTDKGHEGTLYFRHAHRRLDVFVKNFNDGTGSTTPIVQVANIPQGLTFTGMKPIDKDLITAEVQTETVTVERDGKEVDYALAPIHGFYHKVGDHDTEIHIINPLTGEVVYTTKLHEHIDPDTDDPEKDVVIQLLIEFLGDTEVDVTIPDWNIDDVDYGIFD